MRTRLLLCCTLVACGAHRAAQVSSVPESPSSLREQILQNGIELDWSTGQGLVGRCRSRLIGENFVIEDRTLEVRARESGVVRWSVDADTTTCAVMSSDRVAWRKWESVVGSRRMFIVVADLSTGENRCEIGPVERSAAERIAISGDALVVPEQHPAPSSRSFRTTAYSTRDCSLKWTHDTRGAAYFDSVGDGFLVTPGVPSGPNIEYVDAATGGSHWQTTLTPVVGRLVDVDRVGSNFLVHWANAPVRQLALLDAQTGAFVTPPINVEGDLYRQEGVPYTYVEVPSSAQSPIAVYDVVTGTRTASIDVGDTPLFRSARGRYAAPLLVYFASNHRLDVFSAWSQQFGSPPIEVTDDGIYTHGGRFVPTHSLRVVAQGDHEGLRVRLESERLPIVMNNVALFVLDAVSHAQVCEMTAAPEHDMSMSRELSFAFAAPRQRVDDSHFIDPEENTITCVRAWSEMSGALRVIAVIHERLPVVAQTSDAHWQGTAISAPFAIAR